MNQKDNHNTHQQSRESQNQPVNPQQNNTYNSSNTGGTSAQQKVVKHVRFEQSFSNSEEDQGSHSKQNSSCDHQHSHQWQGKMSELSNNQTIDKYNKHRYDAPTYLTVQTLSQIEKERLTTKQQRTTAKQQKNLKTVKSESESSKQLLHANEDRFNVQGPSAERWAKTARNQGGAPVKGCQQAVQEDVDAYQMPGDQNSAGQQAKHPYSKNVNISTTKIYSAQSNSARQQVIDEEESFQNVHSFEGSSFSRKIKDRHLMNHTMIRNYEKPDPTKDVQRQAQKYDEIMQSIDESQLGFVNNHSDEVLRTHSESSDPDEVITPSKLLDQPINRKSGVAMGSRGEGASSRSPAKTGSPKDNHSKVSLQKDSAIKSQDLLNVFDGGEDQSFDEKQFYLKFKSSVLQDHNRPGAAGPGAPRVGPSQNLSGPHSGIQSAAISQNQTPETSNNVPLQFMSQVKQHYGAYGEPIDPGSMYLTNQAEMQNHYSQNQQSLALHQQQIDSQQMEFKEENTFDFLSSYQSDKDEDYSEKEDLIMNKKFYAKDLTKPFEKNISKAEVQCLLKDQLPIMADSFPPEVDESSLMALPYNFRDKEKMLGKRGLQESSMMQHMNSNQKESGMNSYQFDNGYTEYLLQSQNIQNSLLNNYQSNLPDNSIEPIITRNRGRQQSVTRGAGYNISPAKPTAIQRSEKSFSFCNSLRENSMNHERAAERSRAAVERSRRVMEGSSYREQRNSRRLAEGHAQVNGPSYQNNYYYNFNNNYNGVLPPGPDQDRLDPSHPSRPIETRCVEVQVSPTMIDQEEKQSVDQMANFQNLIQQQIPQFCEHFASKKKRGRKAKMKQAVKVAQGKATQSEQQEVLNSLTSQISKIYGAGTKTLSKDELAQIGQYQVMLMQFLHQQSNIDVKGATDNNQTKKLQAQYDFRFPGQIPRPFPQQPQGNPNQPAHPKVMPFPGTQFMQSQARPPEVCVPPPQAFTSQSGGGQQQPPTAPSYQMAPPQSKAKASPSSAAPPDEKINFFFNEQLVEIIRQLDMYIQLLYQVLILMKTKSDSKKKSKKPTDKLSKPEDDDEGILSESNHELSDDDFLQVKERPSRVSQHNPETQDGLKYQVYNLLYDVIKRREDAVNQFKLDHNITPLNPIPKYEVPWITHWMIKSESMLKVAQRPADQLVFRTMPQISYFQVPLLEFAPQVIDAFLNPFPAKECNNPTNVFLRMRPLLNQNLLPINTNKNVKRHMMFKPPPSAQAVLDQLDHQQEDSDVENECIDPFDSFFDPVFMSEKEYYMYGSLDFKKKYQVFDTQSTCQQDVVFPYASNTRRKFSVVDDSCLLMAITSLGSPKDFESINMHWLMHKTQSEIKHRLKNLTCQRAPDNIIKRWKMQYNMPLRQGWMTKEGALGTKVVKPSYQVVAEDSDSHKSKKNGRSKDHSEQESNGEDDSSHGSVEESEEEGKSSSRHLLVQKPTRNKKLYYYNEMHNLALGIKWFGTRSLSQETLKSLLDKFLSMDKKNISVDVDPLYLQPHNIEKLIHMSQLSRWNQISKYFIPSRSGEFLRLEYSNIISTPEKCSKFTSILINSPDFKSHEEIESAQLIKGQKRRATYSSIGRPGGKDRLVQWSKVITEAREDSQPTFKFKHLFNIIDSNNEDTINK